MHTHWLPVQLNDLRSPRAHLFDRFPPRLLLPPSPPGRNRILPHRFLEHTKRKLHVLRPSTTQREQRCRCHLETLLLNLACFIGLGTFSMPTAAFRLTASVRSRAPPLAILRVRQNPNDHGRT